VAAPDAARAAMSAVQVPDDVRIKAKVVAAYKII